MAFSVDGSFVQETGAAGRGMILRDNKVAVIFLAYRFIFLCNNAFEAEISVVLEGMSLSMQWSELVIIIQSDSSVAIAALIDQSPGDIKKLLALRGLMH